MYIKLYLFYPIFFILFLIQNTSIASDFSKSTNLSKTNLDILVDLPVDRSLLTNKNQKAPQTAPPKIKKISDAPPAKNQPVNKNSFNITKQPSPLKKSAVLAKQDVINFINRKIFTFPSYNRGQSLILAHQFLYDQIKNKQSLRSEEDWGYFLGIVRLSLEFNFYPANLTRAQHVQNLLDDLNKLISKFDTSNDATMKKFANYARIYAGKCLVILSRFDEAVIRFNSVEKGYTKVYRLDLAKLVLEGHYIPNDLGFKTLEEYALTLLDTKENSTRSSNKGRTSIVKKSDKSTVELAHPSFLNAQSVKNEKERIRKMALDYHTRNLTPISQPARPNSSNAPPSMYTVNKMPKLNKYGALPSIKKQQPLSPDDHYVSGSKRPYATLFNDLSDASGFDNIDNNNAYANTDDNNSDTYIDNNDDNANDEIDLNFYPEDESAYIEYQKCIVKGKTLRSSEAVQHLQNAIDIAKKLEDDLLLAEAIIAFADRMNIRQERIRFYKNALDLLKDLDQPVIKAGAYIGLVYAVLDTDSKLALEYGNKALAFLRDSQDPLPLARAYLALAYAHKSYRNKNEAVSCLRKILDIVGNSNHILIKAQTHIALSDIIKEVNGYDQALKLLALTNCNELKAKAYLGKAKNGPGNREQKTILVKKALNLLDGIDAPTTKAKANLWLAHSLPPAEKINFYQTILKELENTDEIKLKATIYIALADTISNDINKRIFYAREALKIIKNTNLYRLTARAFIILGKLNAIDENHKNKNSWFFEALDYHKNFFNTDLEFLALIYICLGNYGEMNESEKAEYFEKALFNLNKLEAGDRNINLEVQAHNGLGHAYLWFNDKDAAADQFNVALSLIKPNIDSKVFYAEALYGLVCVAVHSSLVDEKSVDFIKAEELLKEMRNCNLDEKYIQKAIEKIDKQRKYFSPAQKTIRLINDCLYKGTNKISDIKEAKELLDDLEQKSPEDSDILTAKALIKYHEILFLLSQKTNRENNLRKAKELYQEMLHGRFDEKTIQKAHEQIKKQEDFLNTAEGKYKIIGDYVYTYEFESANRWLEEMKTTHSNDKSVIRKAESLIAYKQIAHLLFIKENKRKNLKLAEDLLDKMKSNNLDEKFIANADKLIAQQHNYLNQQ